MLASACCYAKQSPGQRPQDWGQVLEWLQLPFFVRADLMGTRTVGQGKGSNWVDRVTRPVSWFRWGGEARLRHEYLENAATITKDDPRNIQSYQRYRLRVWGEANPCTNLTLRVGLTTEPRLFFMPFPRGHSGWNRPYGFFDQLYLDWHRPGDLPVDFRIGRQNIMLGDGWLVAEGTPLDGSRAYSFDAIRTTVHLDSLRTKADVIYIDQGAWNNSWLPTLNHQPEPLSMQDERSVVVSTTHEITEWLQLGHFFCFKHDYHPLVPRRRGHEGDIYTYGPRVAFLLNRNIYGYIEGAYQWGEEDGRDLDAFGVNTKLAYRVNDPLHSEVWVVYEYLSGDNSKTRANEEFNLLWGSWPRWSELMLHVTGKGEHQTIMPTNLQRIGVGWDMQPMRPLSVSLGYQAIFAAEPDSRMSALDPQLFTRQGDFRGHLAQGFVRYQFSRYWSGYLWGEVLFPGNFYRYQDPFLFFRVEAKLRF